MPTFSQLTAVPLKESHLHLPGISARAMQEHFKLYEGYIKKTNEIRQKLLTADMTTANQIFSEWRSLKTELSFAIGGVKNHEIYFEHLGTENNEPYGKILNLIEKTWGSYDSWKKDMKATGLSARGWVWTAFDRDNGQIFNYLGDAQNTYPIWNAVPLIAMDTYEHAYYLDFGVDRGSYIDAFLTLLDWGVINKNLEKKI